MKEHLFAKYMSPADDFGGGSGSSAGLDPRIGDDPAETTSTDDDSPKGDDDPEKDDDDEDDDDLDLDDDDDDDDDDGKPKGRQRSRQDDSDHIERIARAVAQGMHSRQPQDQTQTRLSDADIKKLLHTYEIDNETLKEMLGLGDDDEIKPSQLKAAQRMVAGVIKNATSVSNAAAAVFQKQLESKLAHYDQFLATQQQEQAQTRFFRQYPYLEKYQKIVNAVADDMSRTDPDWNRVTFEEGSRRVAREVRRILKDSGIKVSKNTQGGEANHGAEPEVRNNGVPAMSRSMGSGRSSTSGGRGKQLSDDEAVYGPGNTGW